MRYCTVTHNNLLQTIACTIHHVQIAHTESFNAEMYRQHCYRSHSLILVTGSSIWHLMAKNSLRIWIKSIVALHKDGVGFKKMPRPWNWAAAWRPRPYRTGSTQNRPRHGRPKRVWVHMLSVISRGCVLEIDVWVLPASLQRLKGCGSAASAQTIRRTLYQIGLHGCCSRRKPL